MINKIGLEEFNEIINNEEVSSLISFYSSFDESMDAFNDVLNDVSEEREDIEVYSIDADEVSSLVLEYRIEFLPTMLLVKRGELIEKLEGFHTTGELLEELERYF